MTLSVEDVELFKSNPFAIIDKYGDVLQADDKPTPIFIEEESQIQGPLDQKYDVEETEEGVSQIPLT